MAKRRLNNPVLFICDIQEKFRPVIYEYNKVISTTIKLLKAAKILTIPIIATTQSSSRLGPTCHELDPFLQAASTTTVDKTAFSMLVPELNRQLEALLPRRKDGEGEDDDSCRLECVIVGIETHICVTQTTLDLLARGHAVYVVADAVSSCNEGERSLALDRLRAEGARVVTSEALLYEIMGDAAIAEFRDVAALVKDEKDRTRDAVGALCGSKM